MDITEINSNKKFSDENCDNNLHSRVLNHESTENYAITQEAFYCNNDMFPQEQPQNIDNDDGENNISSTSLDISAIQLKREYIFVTENSNEESPSKFIKLNCDTRDMLKIASSDSPFFEKEDHMIKNNLNGKNGINFYEKKTLNLSEKNKLSLNSQVNSKNIIENYDPQNCEMAKNKSLTNNSETETCSGNIDMENDQNINITIDNICKSMDRFEHTPSTSSSSTSTGSELEDIFSENRDNINQEISDDDNNESESQSSSSEWSRRSTFSEEDDFDLVSWDIGLHVPFTEDSGSSFDEQKAGNSEEKIPKVLRKSLPIEKFSLLKEVFNRQFKGDDVKRRKSLQFENKICSSRRMVQRLELYKSLKKHSGCVNCVSFNDSGNILISTSDDRHVCLWDWSRNKSILFFDSGHVANVFQAKFLPNSGDTKLITCGQDQQIRMALLDSCGIKNTRLIIKHAKTVHKIALQRQMPNTFLSAGEDGVVYSIDIRESKPYCTKLLEMVGYRRNNTVCLYSIHCNPLKNYEFVVCGNDKDIRLFDQRKISQNNAIPIKTFCPIELSTSDSLLPRKMLRSVTCAVFNFNGTEILSSYNDNDIYLFDSNTGKEVHHYDGHRNFATIKGVNFYGPRSEYVVSGSDCGYIYIWDKNYEAIVQWLKGDDNVVNCLEPHPSFPVLATSGLDSDVKVWMPTSDVIRNITELKEFQRVTKKNNYYKYANFSKYPGRSCVVRSIFDTEDFGHEYARSRLPIILRYRRALRAVRQRIFQRSSAWSSSEEQNDRDGERSCDSLD